MNDITPVMKRIIPAKDVFEAVLRSFLYMRSVFISLFIALIVNSFLIFLVERGLSAKDGIRPVTSIAEAIYLSFATAFSVSFGNVSAISDLGRMLLLIDALIGITFLGLIVWVIQYCLQDTSLKESKYFIFSTSKDVEV